MTGAHDRYNVTWVRLSQGECLGCGAGGSGAACGAHGAYRRRPGGAGNHVDVAATWLQPGGAAL